MATHSNRLQIKMLVDVDVYTMNNKAVRNKLENILTCHIDKTTLKKQRGYSLSDQFNYHRLW